MKLALATELAALSKQEAKCQFQIFQEASVETLNTTGKHKQKAPRPL